jgi:GNAT superfamily N-acetyltransferase
MKGDPYRPRAIVAHRVETERELDAVADLLARAFFSDPVWSWVFPDSDRRLESLRVLWRGLAGEAAGNGSVWGDEDGRAAAVWVPPGRPELSEESEVHLMARLEPLLADGGSRLRETFEHFDQAHPNERGPHHYLSLLGTHREHTGQGYGMGLVAANLRRLDTEGAAAYLESTNPANDRRYERLGFRVCGEFTLPGGPTVTQMWREAAPAGAQPAVSPSGR